MLWSGKGVSHINYNEGLLSFIHKNAALGVSTIPQVMQLPQSRAMGDALNAQLREYRTITAQAQQYANARGRTLPSPGAASRALSAAALRTRTSLDPSTSRLAELMIRDSTSGAVQITRKLHQYGAQTDSELRALGNRLLRTQEQSILQMKRFL